MVEGWSRLRRAADYRKYFLEASVNRRLPLEALRRLRCRKEGARLIGKTGDEPGHVEVFECRQKLRHGCADRLDLRRLCFVPPGRAVPRAGDTPRHPVRYHSS